MHVTQTHTHCIPLFVGLAHLKISAQPHTAAQCKYPAPFPLLSAPQPPVTTRANHCIALSNSVGCLSYWFILLLHSSVCVTTRDSGYPRLVNGFLNKGQALVLGDK